MTKHFSLSQLLVAGVLGSLFCILLISSIAIWHQYKTLINTQTIYEYPLTVTNSIRDIRVHTRGILELTHTAAYHSDAWDEDVANKTAELETKIDKSLGVIEKRLHGSYAGINRIRVLFEEQKKLAHATFDILRKQNRSEAVAFLEKEKINAKYLQLSTEVNDILLFTQKEAKKLTDDAELQLRNGLYILFTLSTLTLLVGVLLSAILIRYIRREFGLLHKFTTDIQNNKLYKISIDENDNNEFAELKSAMNEMVEGLVNAHDKANEAYGSLSRQSALNRTLLDNSAVGIFLASPDRKITQASKRACEMFGYSHEKMENASFRLIHVSDESFEAFAPEYKRLSAEGITNIEYPFARKDKSIFWCSVSGSALDPSDLSKGVIWTLLDIDEKIKAQDELKKLNAELAQKVAEGIEELRQKDQLMIQQAKMAAMGEMIGNIAHQWRQPLNTLMVAKDLLVVDHLEGSLSQKEISEYSKQTTKTLKYLSKTIDDFRNFFKVSKTKEPFNVVNSLSVALSLASAALNHHNIELSFVPDRENIEAFGFESEFQQVVINILNNAKDAIEANNINGKITISATEENGFVRTTIEDNGGGIPLDVLGKIFEPYFTTKFKSQGTGLGLFMAKTIIETNMQGKISAKNSGSGAVFTIDLPSKRDIDA